MRLCRYHRDVMDIAARLALPAPDAEAAVVMPSWLPKMLAPASGEAPNPVLMTATRAAASARASGKESE